MFLSTYYNFFTLMPPTQVLFFKNGVLGTMLFVLFKKKIQGGEAAIFP